MKFVGRGPGLLGNDDPIRSPKFKQRYHYQGRRSRISYGSVACSCATWNGEELLTGTTLLKLGSLERLLLVQNNKSQPLQMWFRNVRQSRYTRDEQNLLDLIIKPAINSYHTQVTAYLGHSEKDIMDREKALVVPDLSNPQLTRKEAGVIKKAAKDESEEKRKSLKRKLPSAQEEALKQLIERGHRYIPSVTAAVFNAQPVLGMSYEGTSYDLKRKCPVCEAIFHFAFAKPDQLKRLKQNWTQVGEVDITRIDMPAGCCAEAMAAVLLVDRKNALKSSLQQLFAAQKHRLDATAIPNLSTNS